MSGKSSAWHIAYDIRPGKQIERRLVMESLQAAKAPSVPVDNLRFVGMGGFRFIDFLLANRVLGVNKFTSIEHDEAIIPRCEFNKPFSGIELFSGSSSEYIEKIGFSDPAIIWFDYERGVSSDLKDDMLALAGAVKPGSFVFITATAELPQSLKNLKGLAKRRAALQEDVTPLAANVIDEDMNAQIFHLTAAKILLGAIRLGFAGRADGVFYPYLRLTYKDSTWMMTIGGYFGVEAKIKEIQKSLKERCGFLKPDNCNFVFQVEQFNITDAERRLMDRAAIAPKARRSERIALRKLGIRQSIVDQYEDLMRFVPRYYESII